MAYVPVPCLNRGCSTRAGPENLVARTIKDNKNGRDENDMETRVQGGAVACCVLVCRTCMCVRQLSGEQQSSRAGLAVVRRSRLPREMASCGLAVAAHDHAIGGGQYVID
ncbi:hypothetical protein E2562_023899 [Oryza meyeriana var. granulata]|uniref:Uncharacterized protein n=1 Tax=Oryza meyeriana var. granulata TaxID=110450 RepID=A0A6G1D7K2_9ORYZ|nr:hypothetical protein E2562_023899 [Oryza meyeriana var. granulata]